MARIKKIITGLIVLGFIIPMNSCSLYDLLFPSEDEASGQDNYCEFTITRGTVESDYTWGSSSDQGFLESSGYYFRIFTADNSSDSDGFRNYLFLNVADNSPGDYSSSDGVSDVTYYDASGEMYMVFSDRSETYIDITISTWSRESVTGSFGGVLMAYPSYDYVGIQGTFVSFDSVSRGVSRVDWEQDRRNAEGLSANDLKY